MRSTSAFRLVEVGSHEIKSSHQLEVNLSTGLVHDLTNGRSYQAARMPQVMVEILNAGGLVNYLKRQGDYGGVN